MEFSIKIVMSNEQNLILTKKLFYNHWYFNIMIQYK